MSTFGNIAKILLAILNTVALGVATLFLDTIILAEGPNGGNPFTAQGIIFHVLVLVSIIAGWALLAFKANKYLFQGALFLAVLLPWVGLLFLFGFL